MKRRHLKAATEARPRWSKFFLVATAAASLLLPALFAPPAVAVAECPTGQNRIVCENEKPGSPWQEWDVQGAGDSSIQGFATDISVNVGERIDFKVDTDAADYTIDIYRTGWYQGLGARKITTVSPSSSLPQIQPECLSDVSTELTDCGTWAVSGSWDVPSDAVSGVYLAKLTRADNNDASHITFIVRDESSTSDVLVQTSDPTWHAYNLYGGSDFYSGGDNGRAYKISYNRPFATRAGIEARDFYFGAEYPLVRFLERNGYDVSYFSGVDTDRHGDLLKNHNVFLSVGHDEYWSGAQRENVEAAREAGVNLQFLSGNEVYWRTRYEPSSTGGNDYRTLTSYKETWSNTKIDPSEQWTGTWRDPRFADTDAGAGLPENALTGTAYVVNHGDMPVTVNEEEGKLRLWRDTPLDSLAPGDTVELAPHTVGYESNEDLPNGFRPPGLIHLSTTTGHVPQYLQDFGNVVGEGETTHHTTLYRADSGALVFSAGSIQWTWGLDEWHDGDGAPADLRMQQAQANLLADMGALPTTLMDELTMPTSSTDTAAPTIHVETAPIDPVKNGAEVTIAGTANDADGQVAGVEYSVDGGASWKPAAGTTSWSFKTIQRGVGERRILIRGIDDSANFPQEATSVHIDVEGPYSVLGQEVPLRADGGDGDAVELGLRFTVQVDGYLSGVRFYKSKANTGSHSGSLWSLDGQRLATTTFSDETAEGWQSASFNEPVEAHAGTEFVVSYNAPNGHYSSEWQAFGYRGIDAIPMSVAGGYGTPAAGVYNTNGGFPSSSWERSQYFVDAIFETGEAIELSAYGHSPADTAVSVPTSVPVTATLSKEAQPGTVAITLKNGQDADIPGATNYDATTRKATFIPEEELPQDTNLKVTITAKDLSGNDINRGGSWSFRTVVPDPADPNDCPCGLFSDSLLPDVPSVTDGIPVTLGTRFSSVVDGQVNGLEFYRSSDEKGSHSGWLYSHDGQALAEVEFPNISVSGWQYAALDTPVEIQAGVEYVAAYRSNGVYPVSPGALSSGKAVGPLRTGPSAGQFTYPDGFPANSSSTNYLVDVQFSAKPPAMSVTSRVPATGESNVAVDTEVSIVFSEALAAGYELSLGTETGSINGTTSLSSDGKKLSFVASDPLPLGTVVTATTKGISGIDTGPLELPPWVFRTAGSTTPTDPDDCPCGLFSESTVPDIAAVLDGIPVTLGTRFSASQDGLITGLEFYRSAGEAGPHTGWLYTSTGQTLAEVTIPDVPITGWQYVPFTSPVSIQSGVDYVVAYRSNGVYPVTLGALASGFQSGPLYTDNSAGHYGYASGFPSTQTSSSYLVDVRFMPATAPLTVSGQSPAPGEVNVALNATVSATFSDELADGYDMLVSTIDGIITGTVSLSEDERTITFTPSVPLPESAVVTVTPTGIIGVEAGMTQIPPWSFRTITGTGGGDLDNCPCGLFSDTLVPDVPAINDGRPVMIGTQFAADSAGEITGLEFYRSPGETGPHTGWLYTAGGHVLAEIAIPDISVTGWHYAEFDTPISIAAGTDYVVAYRSNSVYPTSPGTLSTGVSSGPLFTRDVAGRYTYDAGFPDNESTSNYLVDVRFVPSIAPLEITSQAPAPGAFSVPVDTPITVSFSESLASGYGLSAATMAGAITGTTTLSPDGQTLEFAPSEPLPEGTLVTVTPTGIVGTQAGETVVPAWTFRTVIGSEESVSFIGDQEPNQLDPQDGASVELGMRLVTHQDIEVQAIRYYQGPLGATARTGTIWSVSGVRLATVNFDAVATVGWQTAYLDDPLHLSADTEFTVSHHAPSGGYVYTSGDFAQGKTDGVLSLVGDNGLFAYGASSLPTGSWNDTNYFVDVVYAVFPETPEKASPTDPSGVVESTTPSSAPPSLSGPVNETFLSVAPPQSPSSPMASKGPPASESSWSPSVDSSPTSAASDDEGASVAK